MNKRPVRLNPKIYKLMIFCPNSLALLPSEAIHQSIYCSTYAAQTITCDKNRIKEGETESRNAPN